MMTIILQVDETKLVLQINPTSETDMVILDQALQLFQNIVARDA